MNNNEKLTNEQTIKIREVLNILGKAFIEKNFTRDEVLLFIAILINNTKKTDEGFMR